MGQRVLPVSVIVPVHNHAAYLRQCLLSLSSAEARPAEIILVDNASTDGSADLAAGLGIDHLRILRNTNNVGATRARDQAVAESTQPYLCFIDSDDWLGLGALTHAMADIDSSGSDISLFRMVRVDLSGNILFELPPPPSATGLEAVALTLGCWRIDSRGIYTRALYVAVMKRVEFHGHSDDEHVTRMSFAAARKISGNRGQFFYRDTPKSQTWAKVTGQTLTNLKAVELAVDMLGPRHIGTLAMRKVVARNFAGLLVRAAKRQGSFWEVARLHRRFVAVRRTSGGFTLTEALIATAIAPFGGAK